MELLRKASTPPIIQTMKVDDTERLSAFVRRLRRIEAHPLIAADGGALIHDLYTTPFRQVVYPDLGEVVMKYDLPDEVQFESLAARLRPMTLASDKLGYARVLDSLDALTDAGDLAVGLSNTRLRQEWKNATQRDRDNRGTTMRAYWVVIDDEQVSDLDLAYAWLYEDSMHGDLPSFEAFGPRERYKAATNVFSHIAVVALETLAYVRFLIAEGCLALPGEALTAEVVVAESVWEERGRAMLGPPRGDGDDHDWTGDDVFDGMHPIHEVIRPVSEPLSEQPEDC